MFPNYIQQTLDTSMGNAEMMYMDMCPTRYLSFSLNGFGRATMVVEDETFSEALHLCSKFLQELVDFYKDKYVFDQPQLIWKPDGIFEVKIPMMHKERYEEILKILGREHKITS